MACSVLGLLQLVAYRLLHMHNLQAKNTKTRTEIRGCN
jgi:hypothetical protein